MYTLLGGKMRERIPLSYSVPHGEPEQMAEFALERAGEGFRTIKVKTGQGLERDAEAVRRVRETIGSAHRVRVDANMAMGSAKEAIRLVERIMDFDPEMLEQPMPAHDLHAMAEIRRSVSLPIMADESVGPPHTAMDVIRREAADVLNVYVVESGGIQNAARIFTLAEQAGLGMHDREHARARHRHRRPDPPRHRDAQSRFRQRHLRVALPGRKNCSRLHCASSRDAPTRRRDRGSASSSTPRPSSAPRAGAHRNETRARPPRP